MVAKTAKVVTKTCENNFENGADICKTCFSQRMWLPPPQMGMEKPVKATKKWKQTQQNLGVIPLTWGKNFKLY